MVTPPEASTSRGLFTCKFNTKCTSAAGRHNIYVVADPSPAEGVQASARLVVPTELGETMALYANYVHVTFTPEDFTMHLGWYALPPFTEPPSGDFEVQIRPLAKVTLPLNLVRGVVNVLERQMEAWEKSFGMPLPEHPNPPPGLVADKPREHDEASR
jgi:hypothetical protein